MNRNYLIPVDWSKSSMHAVEYAADLLKYLDQIRIVLIHVMLQYPYLGPTETVPSELKEKHEAEKASYEEAEDVRGRKCLERARETLLAAGIGEKRIQTKYVEPLGGRNDVAVEILEEAKHGNYDTIIMGKRGLSEINRFLLGSVTEKIVRYAKGFAIWVVE